MQFVPVKTEEQQAALAVRRARDLLMHQRTQLINALRAHMPEMGIVAETVREGDAKLVEVVAEARSTGVLPAEMIKALSAIIDHRLEIECAEHHITINKISILLRRSRLQIASHSCRLQPLNPEEPFLVWAVAG